jgi:hypothetical protein
MTVVHSNAKKKFGVDKQSRSGGSRPFKHQLETEAGHGIAEHDGQPSIGSWLGGNRRDVMQVALF